MTTRWLLILVALVFGQSVVAKPRGPLKMKAKLKKQVETKVVEDDEGEDTAEEPTPPENEDGAKEKAAPSALTVPYDFRITYGETSLTQSTTPAEKRGVTLVASPYLRWLYDLKGGVHFNLLVDLAPDAGGYVKIASVEKAWASGTTLSAGLDALRLGGFEQKRLAAKPESESFRSRYLADVLPLGEAGSEGFVPQLSLRQQFGRVGALSVQLVNDNVLETTEPSEAATSSLEPGPTARQPAVATEWASTWGPLALLVQAASYDLNQSHSVLGGFGVKVNGFDSFVEYGQDWLRVPGSSDKIEIRHLNFYVAERIRMIEPFLKFSLFDVRQAELDFKGNHQNASPDDNLLQWAFGINWLSKDGRLEPYLLYLGESERHLVNARDPSQTEGTTASQVALGVRGTL